jgi:hypothetical protein
MFWKSMLIPFIFLNVFNNKNYHFKTAHRLKQQLLKTLTSSYLNKSILHITVLKKPTTCANKISIDLHESQNWRKGCIYCKYIDRFLLREYNGKGT